MSLEEKTRHYKPRSNELRITLKIWGGKGQAYYRLVSVEDASLNDVAVNDEIDEALSKIGFFFGRIH